MRKTQASVAMVDVLKSWGVKNVYGIPGGSFNSTMYALFKEQKDINYIQVRHEEVGAIAASAYAKLSGQIGVCFGTAGPGATHLFNGLYDAQMDHAPVLALIGQVGANKMNYNAFQELNENPMFVDVSVYNRTVMTPESLPHVIDEAIKHAYQYKGVAVVTIPVDFGKIEIDDNYTSTAPTYRTGTIQPDEKDIKEALALIERAKQPILYIGRGLEGGWKDIEKFCEYFSVPIASSAMGKGIIPDQYPNYVGQAGRVATKPGVEALAVADLIIFAGSDFPFAEYFFNKDAKFIHINTDLTTFGRRHKTDVAIYGDGKLTLQKMTELGKPRPKDKWLAANQENKTNWRNWIRSFYDNTDSPLRPEPVFREINRIAEEDAIFISDVGNVTINSVRHLDLNGKQKFTISGWFATMGYGVPGGIGAKLSFPEKQVFTLSGDGGFAMVMQDIITQVKYNLPIINIVFSNNSFGFIEAEQEDDAENKFGVFLQGADFGKASEAMGALGFTVTDPKELPRIFDEAKASKKPVVIDIKLHGDRPLAVEQLILDTDKYSQKEITDFKEKYQVKDMPALAQLLK